MGAESRRHADRARQFMPFASLRGYYDFIREQERVKEPRRELSEDDAQELSVSLAPGGGNLNKFAARQVRTGDAALCLADIRYTASRDDLTAVDARTGANIDDIVCLTHRVLVVLHDNQGVAQVAQALHRGNQLVVVTLV